MNYRLFKIYTTTELMDAHLLQALFESYAIPAYLWDGNGATMDASNPLGDIGIKIFVDASRKDEAEKIFRDRFGANTEPPYTGPFSVFGSSQESRIILDPRGGEVITWDAGTFDPLAGVEETQADQKPDPQCPSCRASVQADASFCDQCGERLR